MSTPSKAYTMFLDRWHDIKGIQRDSAGTREARCISRDFLMCDDKSINGKESQMIHWESDQLIVVMKQGNACGAKVNSERGWL